MLKHHIPLKTDHWDVTAPGFTELDLVAHCGNSAEGEFAHSLNVSDIQTTWTETCAVLGKSMGEFRKSDITEQALTDLMAGGAEFDELKTALRAAPRRTQQAPRPA